MADCRRYRPLLLAVGVADLGPELLYRHLADVVAEPPAGQEIAQPTPEVLEVEVPERPRPELARRELLAPVPDPVADGVARNPQLRPVLPQAS